MCNCCTDTHDIGCLNACDTIDFGNASETGAHIIYFDSGNGAVYAKAVTVTAPNAIEYTMNGDILQPGYSYRVEIKNPSGSTYERTVGASNYDCQKFTIENTITI